MEDGTILGPRSHQKEHGSTRRLGQTTFAATSAFQNKAQSSRLMTTSKDSEHARCEVGSLSDDLELLLDFLGPGWLTPVAELVDCFEIAVAQGISSNEMRKRGPSSSEIWHRTANVDSQRLIYFPKSQLLTSNGTPSRSRLELPHWVWALGQSPSHPLTLRSNYDCIKQGQAAQLGLHYRTDLTAAANSMRNSHKRAEKNRRDRLALAMQELVMLLPQKSSTSNSSGNQRGGKAETVEIAVQYIKQLQEEVNALKRLALSPSISRTCLHDNTTAQDQ
ncbi:hypothetical protein AYO21_03571 [Fonsecaea monophora]|uniref:BHLH domain-containing protein n=1 Tax=Fonsecaea monophora TaxID=254056 RepID=A0A177FD16_9EURO|nr:hypothetical protein AYO21_03571 [Fonsecaea monophora]OAG42117.1 hypothetical protein AYO21_03571 [Fonsecaea monophora]